MQREGLLPTASEAGSIQRVVLPTASEAVSMQRAVSVSLAGNYALRPTVKKLYQLLPQVVCFMRVFFCPELSTARVRVT